MTSDRTAPPAVDMSPEAIDRRLRMVVALRKLCVSLKQAGEQAAKNDAADDADEQDRDASASWKFMNQKMACERIA